MVSEKKIKAQNKKISQESRAKGDLRMTCHDYDL